MISLGNTGKFRKWEENTVSFRTIQGYGKSLGNIEKYREIQENK